MKAFFDAITDLVGLLSVETIQAIASRLKAAEKSSALGALSGVVNSPVARTAIADLVQAWMETEVTSQELALMLVATANGHQKFNSLQQIELVWTGPTTPVVPARRTEQVLLQVINAAQKSLFITSFVAYDVSNVVQAINAAAYRGVQVKMLLESSQGHGGSIEMDVIGAMRSVIPRAAFFAWGEKAGEFINGRVHAKVVVADAQTCFITSANLTAYAMERNMESGVLITGGHIPQQLDQHLCALIATNVVEKV
jgi:phosphatidylserine/phosphatidylglycerophosphate/cardiolipin synthase-like enzyme